MLAVPAGFDAPRLLRYDDVTAHAITRDDLGADVRGINASLDLIRETRGGTWPTSAISVNPDSASRSAADVAHFSTGETGTVFNRP